MRIDLQRRFPWVRSWRPVLLTVAALGLWNCTCSARGQAADVTIRLRSDQLGPAISPRLIGAFFEDINFGADGGFSAELVINGSFECPSDLLGWRIVGRDVSVAQEREAPIGAANPTFVRIVSTADRVDGGLVNAGYRGMGVKAGESYGLSLTARAVAGQHNVVAARLVAEDGGTLDEVPLTVEGSAWRPITVSFHPWRTDAKAHLELLLRSRGQVDLDLVSLCPTDTWQARPQGLRKDVVQLLADLKPAFFRFPGGCIVEGSQLKYRYQWKTTIGPRDQRRMLVNRWNTEFRHRWTPDYYQSFAVGFFEYFQLAEDLGAEPMPIINCGMACQFNSGELVPLGELEPYIQDALDLIEFASGPATSPWGAKRAAMGHPEPFNLRWLGIGNEQWGPEYFQRYERFAEVLEAEHPEVSLISTSGPFPAGRHFDFAWPLLRQLKVPVVDEHCYAMPDWFLREATRYDGYDRNGPKVFMGEYAAQSVQIASPKNRNTLRCALAEAAFLTGIERNSDVVAMSSYAPLMGHEEAWQWRPNLIWFDNLHCYGSPSYYVQKLFSHHRGDVVVPLEIVDERPPVPPSGRVGLGTNNAHVEFRDLTATHGEDLLLDGASLGALDSLETYGGGSWSVADGVIHQKDPGGSPRLMLGDFSWSDYIVRFQARKISGREGIVVYFRNGSGGSFIEWKLGEEGSRHRLVAHLASHSESPSVVADTEGTIEPLRWYDVRIELSGSQVQCYLDDELIHDVDVPAPDVARLFASASLDRQAGETVLKVVNPTDDATLVRLSLDGIRVTSPTCRVITLTGQPEDENSIATPTRVSPTESSLELAPSELDYSFPAHSLTVLRVPTEYASSAEGR